MSNNVNDVYDAGFDATLERDGNREPEVARTDLVGPVQELLNRLESRISEAENRLTVIEGQLGGWLTDVTPTDITYSSATRINTNGFVPGDVFNIGDRLEITQGGSVKYFFVADVNTNNIDIEGGNNYTFTNAPITSFRYSKLIAPIGFPGIDSFVKNPDLTYTAANTYTFTLKNMTFYMLGNVVNVYFEYKFYYNTSAGGATIMNLPLPIQRGTSSDIQAVVQHTVIGLDFKPSNSSTYLLWGSLDSSANTMGLRLIAVYDPAVSFGFFDGITPSYFRVGGDSDASATHWVRGSFSYLVK